MNDHQEAIGKHFVTVPSFAVVGASKDQTKVGNRILRWYQTRDLDVIPVHFKEPELEGIKTIADISELTSPTTTALSIITPPKITLGVLKKAKELDVPSLWIQPGAEDEAVLEYIKENDMTDRVIHGGPCILVVGDGLRSHL
ncbi:CoA-binding protein [Lyophyllum atratum]|nr:CoA-binding protein [Lyophyllum atratum]